MFAAAIIPLTCSTRPKVPEGTSAVYICLMARSPAPSTWRAVRFLPATTTPTRAPPEAVDAAGRRGTRASRETRSRKEIRPTRPPIKVPREEPRRGGACVVSSAAMPCSLPDGVSLPHCVRRHRSVQVGGAGLRAGLYQLGRQICAALLEPCHAVGEGSRRRVVADRLALGRDADLVEREELLELDATAGLGDAEPARVV